MARRDIFRSAAYYYALYRPWYPEELLRRVVEVFHLDGRGRLLDLGCGPGHLMLPLAPYFEEIVGLDPEPEMLVEAQRLAVDRGVTNAAWVEAGAEDIGPEMGKFRLASMGHSFHWMDQNLVLERLHEVVEPGGGLIVLDDATAYTDADPRPVVDAIIKRYLGERRRAGSGYRDQSVQPYEVCFARSSFRLGQPICVPEDWVRSIDWIVGNCFSRSSSSPYVLHDKKEAFEGDLRRELLALNPAGEFKGTSETQAFVLFRD
jgi:SAM-dependent methyltransferase